MRNACITLSLHPSLLLSQLKITNTKQQFLLKIVVWTEVAESISTQNSDDLFLLREKILEREKKKSWRVTILPICYSCLLFLSAKYAVKVNPRLGLKILLEIILNVIKLQQHSDRYNRHQKSKEQGILSSQLSVSNLFSDPEYITPSQLPMTLKWHLH